MKTEQAKNLKWEKTNEPRVSFSRLVSRRELPRTKNNDVERKIKIITSRPSLGEKKGRDSKGKATNENTATKFFWVMEPSSTTVGLSLVRLDDDDGALLELTYPH